MSKGGIVLEVLYAAVFNTELICYLMVIVLVRLCTSKLEVYRSYAVPHEGSRVWRKKRVLFAYMLMQFPHKFWKFRLA